jgi:hypothetical protein
MNKYIILILIIVSGIFSSCDEQFLDEDPKASLAESTFYKSAGDIKLAVNAMINAVIAGDCLGDRQLKATQCADDILTTHPASNKIEYREVDRFAASIGNQRINKKWVEVYKVVYQANAVIGNYQNAEGDADEIEGLASIARFFRALFYFEAVRTWGAVPKITSTVVELDVARSSEQEIYDLIVADLVEAVKWLPETQSIKSYPTVWAAKTMLADVYLTMAGWPLKQTDKYAMATALLKDVKDNSGKELLPDYADLWVYMPDGSNEGHKEVIFSFVKSNKDDIGVWSYKLQHGKPYVDSRFAGWNDMVLEAGFLMRFPNDDRKDATIVTMDGKRLKPATIPWQEFNARHPTLRKFRDGWDIKGQHALNSARDWMHYRFADVLLMYAEAEAMSKSGPTAEAYEAVNAIRARANGLPLTAGLGQIAFRDSIIEEVAWEFAGEDRRWFDLVRTERVEWANDLSRKYNAQYTDGQGNTYTVEDMTPINPPSKGRYVLPIPEIEMMLNPNMEQNEAYK